MAMQIKGRLAGRTDKVSQKGNPRVVLEVVTDEAKNWKTNINAGEEFIELAKALQLNGTYIFFYEETEFIGTDEKTGQPKKITMKWLASINEPPQEKAQATDAALSPTPQVGSTEAAPVTPVPSPTAPAPTQPAPTPIEADRGVAPEWALKLQNRVNEVHEIASQVLTELRQLSVEAVDEERAINETEGDGGGDDEGWEHPADTVPAEQEQIDVKNIPF